MQPMTGPLLVVAHEATRTGGPKVLLDLLRFAVPRLDADVAVRLIAGGALSPDLGSVATVVDDRTVPAAVMVNGALAADQLARFESCTPKVVYVHEEGEALDVLGANARTGLTSLADHLLCVSERSRADLITMGVAPERISILPPVVVPDAAPTEDQLRQLRAELGMADEDRIVVGCGEAGWRKGTDLFVQVACRMRSSTRIHFVWVGRRGGVFGRVLDHDSRSMGLADRFHWTDEVPSAVPYLALADLLVMTSREDPQPLVPLEAAAVGTPTVGFRVGGLVDYESAGAVLAVEYPHVVALAHVASELLADPAAAAALVASAQHELSARHSLERIGPQFVEVLRTMVHGDVATLGTLIP